MRSYKNTRLSTPTLLKWALRLISPPRRAMKTNSIDILVDCVLRTTSLSEPSDLQVVWERKEKVMLKQCLLAVGAVMSLLGGIGATEVLAQFGALSRRIPNGANAIVVLNIEKIHQSPLAQEQNWRAQQENAAAAGLTILPPSADQFIMAAKMDYDFMEPVWETALARLHYEPDLPKFAARFGGTVDRVADRNAVRLPDDSYAVQLSKTVVACMRPGNRQSVARWLRSTNTTQGQVLSPYLKEAIAFAEKVGTPIIMAMDLQDVMAPELVRERLQNLEAMKDSKLDLDNVVKALSSIRGVTLGITIRDKIHGAIKVDFAEDVTFLQDVAKPILLEVLSNQSAMINEFVDWNVTVAGSRVQIGGELYRSGMQRIMSVLDAPAILRQAAESTSPADGPNEETLQRLASQQYFNTVVGFVDDLQNKDKKTLGQVGIWCGRYANKIGGLPLLNVDPKLLDYGGYVSNEFRQAESVLRGAGGRSRVRQLNAPAQYRGVGRWGSDGWYGTRFYGGYVESPRLEAQNRARIRTEERVRGAGSARSVMQDINAATYEIRREMTDKYQVEF